MFDDRWHRSFESAQSRLRQLGVNPSATDIQSMRLQLLVTSYEGQQGAFTEAARRAAENGPARRQPWFQTLASEQIGPADQATHDVLLMLTAPIAAQQTSDQIAEAERAQVAAEQARVARQRTTIDNLAVPAGVICGVLALCVPFAGFIAGPAAVYLGVRARRTYHRSASTWAIVLGALGVLFAVVSAIAAISGSLGGNTPTGTGTGL